MSNYIVSARKYRPETFKSVVGQQALTHTLKAAIDSNRLAHAYLFCGPRGVGKTSCARIFAKTINCLSPTEDGEACNECESCKAFNEQRSYNIIELDAASNNSVDDIRNLIDQVQIPPQIGKYKVFIIDEVHMLSSSAFNAFLKTLEEPPAHAIFILATTEKHKIIPTILSRCQIYDFSRITINDMVEQLKYVASNEGITAETAALNVIAQKADGAMRDALSIFDQVAASSFGNITYQSTIENLNVLDHEYYFRLMETFRTCNVPEALLIYREIRDKGFDSLSFINGLAAHMRNMMVALTPATVKLLEMSDEVAAKFIAEAPKYHPKFYYRALDLCNTCDLNYRTATNKQFIVELTLIKLCQILDNTPPIGGGGNGRQPLRNIGQQTPQAAAQGQAQTQPAQRPQASAAGGSIVSQTSPAYHPTAPRQSTPHHTPTIDEIPQIMINRPQSSPNSDKSATVVAPKTVRNEAFTDGQLLDAWNKFISMHPDKRILTGTMSMSPPKNIGGTSYGIVVENQGQAEIFKSDKDSILAFLRNEIKNDTLTIEVSVTTEVTAHKILSPREIVDEMRLRNPAIEELIRAFNLSLA